MPKLMLRKLVLVI